MTREQAVEFKGIYEARLRRYHETMNDENRTFNQAMIEMSRSCLAIVNRALAQMERKVLAICPRCLQTHNHKVMQSTELRDTLKCVHCRKTFTVEYGHVFHREF